ncbi:MAG: 4-hydroxy-tetrahydrodipicolinate reductase, partial [Clostridia bacterium]|nr:4-hydroxy-tetrahydrodipicolinate reductase [Clostridia bacterium]
MKRIILCGCNGKMGRVLTECIRQRCDCTVVAGFDINTERGADFPVFATPDNCQLEADVIIDFSHPSSLPGVLRFAKSRRIPAVIATTGLSDDDMAAVREAGQEIPVFHSGNMSLGISLLAALARRAAAVLGDSFDVEIVEKHHNQKIDAPSGTALMLADAVEEGLPYQAERVFD